MSYSLKEEAKPPPQKKLRLQSRSKVAEPQLDLHQASNSQDALQLLLKFEERLPIPVEFVDQMIQVGI